MASVPSSSAAAALPFNYKEAGKTLLVEATKAGLGAAVGAASAYALVLPVAAGAAVVGGATLVTSVIGKFCGRQVTKNTYVSAFIQLIAAAASSVLALKAAALFNYSFAKLTAIAVSWNVPYALSGAAYLSGVGIPAVVALAVSVLAVNVIGNQVVKAVGLM